MPTLIAMPTRIEAVSNKPILIDEYIGRVRSGHRQVSIAYLQCPCARISSGKEEDNCPKPFVTTLRVTNPVR